MQLLLAFGVLPVVLLLLLYILKARRRWWRSRRIIDDGLAAHTGNQTPKELIRFLRNSSDRKTNNFLVQKKKRRKITRQESRGLNHCTLPVHLRIPTAINLIYCDSPKPSETRTAANDCHSSMNVNNFHCLLAKCEIQQPHHCIAFHWPVSFCGCSPGIHSAVFISSVALKPLSQSKKKNKIK